MASDQSAKAPREVAQLFHRAGKLDQARTEYERLLASVPDDAEVLGLLGIVARQQGRMSEAASLLSRAFRAPGQDPRIRLQNAHNLFILAKERKSADAARALAKSELPDWPQDSAPSREQRALMLSLCTELANSGRADRALSLLESVLIHLGEDAEALCLSGRLRLKCGDPEGALVDLQRSRRSDRRRWETLAALSTVCEELGRYAEASAAAERIARAGPVYLAPRQERQKATVLVLNRTPRGGVSPDGGLHGVHFTRNYISQITGLMAGEFRFASVFADLSAPLPDLPRADVVFNNIASGDLMNRPGELERVMRVVERVDRPVINHPKAIFQMSRQKAARLLQGIDGLRVPRIERYRREPGRLDSIKADIAAQFTYPVILRYPEADQSSKSLVSDKKTAILVHDWKELAAFLKSVSWSEFYVIQYIDLLREDGTFRKLRAAFFPDEVLIVSGAYNSEWIVARTPELGKIYSDRPYLLNQMRETLLNPEDTLGSHAISVLQNIRDKVPLDFFGMDFDVDEQGRVVLFEVGAAMIFLPIPGISEDLIVQKLDDQLNDAFRRLVRRKISPPAP